MLFFYFCVFMKEHSKLKEVQTNEPFDSWHQVGLRPHLIYQYVKISIRFNNCLLKLAIKFRFCVEFE